MWGDKLVDFRNQPKWDIPDIVVLGVAVVGVFIDREQNPKIPIYPDEIRKAIEECVEIGAVSVHMHVRDDEGRPSASLENFHKVIDPLRTKYGNEIVVDGGCMTGESFPEAVGPVTDGLFEMSIVNPSTGLLGDNLRAMSPDTMKAQAKFFKECGVRPLIDVHDTGSIEKTREVGAAKGAGLFFNDDQFIRPSVKPFVDLHGFRTIGQGLRRYLLGPQPHIGVIAFDNVVGGCCVDDWQPFSAKCVQNPLHGGD